MDGNNDHQHTMEQATETHVCPICADTIVDEGEDECVQDALFCEGGCQCWLHRWCVGVTRERYAVLSSDEEPFLCLSCTVAGQQAAITAQQADIACLRECVNALTSEVRALKATVAVMQSEPPLNSASTSPTGQAKEWSVVVSKGNGNGRKGRKSANAAVLVHAVSPLHRTTLKHPLKRPLPLLLPLLQRNLGVRIKLKLLELVGYGVL